LEIRHNLSIFDPSDNSKGVGKTFLCEKGEVVVMLCYEPRFSRQALTSSCTVPQLVGVIDEPLVAVQSLQEQDDSEVVGIIFYFSIFCYKPFSKDVEESVCTQQSAHHRN
jgi:hypothetical protein